MLNVENFHFISWVGLVRTRLRYLLLLFLLQVVPKKGHILWSKTPLNHTVEEVRQLKIIGQKVFRIFWELLNWLAAIYVEPQMQIRLFFVTPFTYILIKPDQTSHHSYFRSDFSAGLTWLDRHQQEDEEASWPRQVSCDTREKCSYSVCDKINLSVRHSNTSYCKYWDTLGDFKHISYLLRKKMN